jgi:hypothetical protein
MKSLRREEAISTATLLIVAIAVIIVASAAYYGAYFALKTSTSVSTNENGSSQNHSSSNSISTTVFSSSSSQLQTSTSPSPTAQGSSTYVLSQRESIALGWTLDGVYSLPGAAPTNANLFTLTVTNTGKDPLTSLSYGIQYILATIQENNSLASGSSETFQVMFAGNLLTDCSTTAASFCRQQATLDVNVAFSNGETFSIPQTVDIEYGSSVSPYTYNTNSSFCSQLLSSMNTVGTSASLENGQLFVSGGNNPDVGFAAYSIFDPLNSNGLHISGILQGSWNNGLDFSLGNQNFITGKNYDLQLQVGRLLPIPGSVENETYAFGGFCTISLTFLA